MRCAFDAATGVAQLVYAFDDGPELVETITRARARRSRSTANARAAVERALRLLHLIAGVSYYKAAVPQEIRIESYAIDADTAALLETDLRQRPGRVRLSQRPAPARQHPLPACGRRTAPRAPALGLREHALVAIGGGKDSLVSIEALRTLGIAQTVTWIGGSQLIKACAERTGLPTLNIGRALAPELFDYNRAGRVERPHPGDRGELGDPGVRRAAARRRPGGVLQRALGQLRQPDRGHRRGEPPVVEGLGVRAGLRRPRAARTSPPTCTTTRCCVR